MKYTHYTNDKELCNKFKLLGSNSSYYYRLYIKQVQYHTNNRWINMLIDSGVSKAKVEEYLTELRELTHDWDMNVEIWEDK